ncbi:indolepyruvate oxidoreductase subunit beta family protein [Verticiella sediminum]|uniref:Indolepyruvate oxidoreductase subunit beta family protein n=1 Tax=Verticiella sediminum TaxID=1247510 RepID=A0A556AJB7_9BURK|nr:indolepyruvate oxidoreductase subunit beta family protein [Verticiella sediminum]TSH92971.1 indolepyruvate oxidoreductase subunit beta family protein [Verticiella sediminum]
MQAQPIKIAILAMGGEGGGVLADWIVDLGEHEGCIAQTTSVPGVAQRTGATLYYVELFPRSALAEAHQRPVLALMPMPGDVDIVLASELMEAGRAVQRGLVTPERTTLIASTHRVYSIAEKSAMGDGRVDSAELLAHAQRAARGFVHFDMAELAQRNGSVISAVLFGALAGAGVLPFARSAFEATIARGGVGVKPSLKAFGAAFERTRAPEPGLAAPAVASPPAPRPRDPAVAALLGRIEREFDAALHGLLREGVRRLIDYQDPDYAGLYLDRMARVARLPDDGNRDLALATARHLALWMAYEDTIRVADLKTRASRYARVRDEVGATDAQVLGIQEFMHPRLQEVCDTLPARLGRWLQRPHWAHRLLARLTRKGRVIDTTALGGFLQLRLVAGLRRWRLGTLRHQHENARIEDWLARIEATARTHPALATEIARCQRLVKGYGDTHARGLANYTTLMAALERAGASLAPATLRELREAALADEQGKALLASLRRHALA